MLERDFIQVNVEDESFEATAIILVPETALDDPALIQTYSTAAPSQAKHDLYGLVQMALYDYEDGLLTPTTAYPGSRAVIGVVDNEIRQETGLLILRDSSGAPALIAFEGAETKRLLKEAHRYCTRWIRLDI